MDLVLNEEVNQRDECCEERPSKELPVLDSCGVARAQSKAAKSPRQSGHQVGDHKDVVPVVVIGRGNVCPSSAGQCSEDANTGDELGEGRVGTASQDVPEADESESRT